MRTIIKLVIAIAFIGALSVSRRADAARIPIIYQSGQDTFESGPLPEPFDKEPSLAGAQAGYVCDVQGVFWSYFSISSCKPAAIRGEQFDDNAQLGAAIEAKYPEPAIPFWANHGWKLMIGGVVLLAFVAFIRFVRRSKEAVVPELAHDQAATTMKVPAIKAPAKAKADAGDIEGMTVRAPTAASDAYQMHARHSPAFDQAAAIHRYEQMYGHEQDVQRPQQPQPAFDQEAYARSLQVFPDEVPTTLGHVASKRVARGSYSESQYQQYGVQLKPQQPARGPEKVIALTKPKRTKSKRS